MVDEAAIVEGLDEMSGLVYIQLYQLVVLVLPWAPYGVGNWFHKGYIEIEEEKQFQSIKLPWDVHPDVMKSGLKPIMSKREIAQELECNFNASGETVIHDDLKTILENVSRAHSQDGVWQKLLDMGTTKRW